MAIQLSDINETEPHQSLGSPAWRHNDTGAFVVANLTRTIITGALAVLTLGASPARTSRPDTPVARLEALAELQTLNADLLSHDSATLTLDRWCARHHLADGAKIVANRVRGQDKPPPATVREQLHVGIDQPIAYRHVRLRCGDHVLSEADNWYVPSRLAPDMNRTLETKDTAFGRVVQPLRFQRHTVSARLLWSPLPEGWDSGGASLPHADPGTFLPIPDKVIEHQALLTRADGEPFSYVIETYTGAVLDFPPSF
jgi:hypothetical protein